MAARKAHNLEVGGSSPPPAPNKNHALRGFFASRNICNINRKKNYLQIHVTLNITFSIFEDGKSDVECVTGTVGVELDPEKAWRMLGEHKKIIDNNSQL